MFGKTNGETENEEPLPFHLALGECPHKPRTAGAAVPIRPLISDRRTPAAPSGAKFLLTLHAPVTRRALTVQELSTHDYGFTAGRSRLNRLAPELKGLVQDAEEIDDTKLVDWRTGQ